MASTERVVVCGSLAHPDRIAAAVRDELAAGREVIAVPSRDDGLTPDEAAVVWRERIREADRVVVVHKPDGTLGSSTAQERDYALRWGRHVHDRTG